MGTIRVLTAMVFFCLAFRKPESKRLTPDPEAPVYNIVRLKKPMKIDGNWDKPQWRNTGAVEISNYIRAEPLFRPIVQAKMMYDDNNVYVIFRAQDRYVRCLTKDYNGPVWKDAAVEFFFSPDSSLPKNYFNLETNCGGTPLLGYKTVSDNKPGVEDLKKIEIAHSLPQIIDPEMTDPVTWTIEYRIPLDMLEKFSNVTRPRKGVSWRANFYKCAENNSNPHHMTWAPIVDPKPTFHLPQFFGTIKFQ